MKEYSVEWNEVLDELFYDSEIVSKIKNKVTKSLVKNFALQLKEDIESTNGIENYVVLQDYGFSVTNFIGGEEITYEFKWDNTVIKDDYHCIGHAIDSITALLKHLKQVRKTLPKD